jgi:hypothetical protein
MGTVRLIATKAYTYSGRSLQVGDAFEAPQKDADVFKKIGRAKDAPTAKYLTKVSEPTPESQESESTSKRRRYRSRDLIAEN